jgi:hypothetical protein
MLTIIQSQHAKEYSLVLSNFSFLPHMQQQHSTIFNCFFIVTNILLFVVATILDLPIPRITFQSHVRRCCSSIDFFRLIIASTFSRSPAAACLIASICSWKVLLIAGLLLGLICSFKNEIRSFMICCRVRIAIWRTKLKPNGLLLNKLAVKGEGVNLLSAHLLWRL